jgi:F-type H+-transporting ATPase subunit gamma
MPSINEIKEQKVVVHSVGEFAHSLQQIAAARMAKLRKVVMSSRRFVDEATTVLLELQLEKQKRMEKDLYGDAPKGKKKQKKSEAATKKAERTAIIVISTDQGLCGSYNTEIFAKVDQVLPEHQDADWFVIGSKGQDYFYRLEQRNKIRFFPFKMPEQPTIVDLKPLIGMFFYYTQIFMIYSKFINTATREVVFLELVIPNIAEVEAKKELEGGKYIFEPNIDELIRSLSSKLRYALFRQQILDSRLSLYTAQMLAMKTAADNSEDLLKELQLQYNKARRKVIDKKIQEVQAGRSLWEDEA